MDVPPLLPPPGFVERVAALGIEFDQGDLDKLGGFLARMLEVNKSHNLTAITDPDQAWTRHVADALTLLPMLAALGETPRVIDVGSGGGVPGIPLAIAMPAAAFTLIDATGKKVEFLRACAADLLLANVTILQARAERLGHDKAHREAYDAAIARAVGPLPTLVELLAPLIKPDGVALAIKGAKADEELAAAALAMHAVGLRHERTEDTPTGKVVILAKSRRTPRIYPRADGLPKSKPIGA